MLAQQWPLPPPIDVQPDLDAARWRSSASPPVAGYAVADSATSIRVGMTRLGQCVPRLLDAGWVSIHPGDEMAGYWRPIDAIQSFSCPIRACSSSIRARSCSLCIRSASRSCSSFSRSSG